MTRARRTSDPASTRLPSAQPEIVAAKPESGARPGRHEAFLDEYGNTDIDTEKDGATRWFVVVAVVVPASRVEELRAGVEAVRKATRSQGQLKSANLRKDPARYAAVLDGLHNLDLRFGAVAVDKARVDPTSGLRWRRSFHKYASKLLYWRLFDGDRDLVATADTFGDERFMAEVQAYVDREHAARHPSGSQFSLPLADLGPGTGAAAPRVRHVKAATEPLVQAADVIAGAIGRALAGGADAAWLSPLVLELRKKGTIDVWPGVPFAGEPDDDTSDDGAVRRAARRSVGDYLHRTRDEEDLPTRMLRATLDILVLPRMLGEPTGWVHRGMPWTLARKDPPLLAKRDPPRTSAITTSCRRSGGAGASVLSA